MWRKGEKSGGLECPSHLSSTLQFCSLSFSKPRSARRRTCELGTIGQPLAWGNQLSLPHDGPCPMVGVDSTGLDPASTTQCNVLFWGEELWSLRAKGQSPAALPGRTWAENWWRRQYCDLIAGRRVKGTGREGCDVCVNSPPVFIWKRLGGALLTKWQACP